MAWWAWVLIGIGVVVLGALKVTVLKNMAKRKAEKKKFADED